MKTSEVRTGRTQDEIIRAILNVAESGATRTIIMYKVYLSSSQSQRLLQLLVAEELMQYVKTEMNFQTTPKGLEYLGCHGDIPTKDKCSHQCVKCGVVYDCSLDDKCCRSFQYGRCSVCQNSVIANF